MAEEIRGADQLTAGQSTSQQTSQQQPEAGSAAQATTRTDYDAIFQKLDSILDKRSGGIARSALKDNGIEEGEAQEILAAYRQQKADAAKQQTEALTKLQNENQQLRAQMLESRLTAEATAQAGTLNVAPESVPYLLRLADLSGAVDEQGGISKEKVTEALNKVLEDIPALKQQPRQAAGFQPIGGDGKDPTNAEAEDRMRSWFGLPPKKK